MFARTISIVVVGMLIGSAVDLSAQRSRGGYRPPPVIRGGGSAGPARPPGAPSKPRTGPTQRRQPGQPATAARGGAAGSAPRAVVPAPKSPEVAKARAAAKPRLDGLRQRLNAGATARAGAGAKPPVADEAPRNLQERTLLQAARDRELKNLNKPIGGGPAPLADAQRMASVYGGRAQDWVRMSGGYVTSANGQRVEVQYFKNISTGKVVEWKFERQVEASSPKRKP